MPPDSPSEGGEPADSPASDEREQRYWYIDIYNEDEADVSVVSEEELPVLREMNDIAEWQIEEASAVSEDDMVDRLKDRGYRLKY